MAASRHTTIPFLALPNGDRAGVQVELEIGRGQSADCFGWDRAAESLGATAARANKNIVSAVAGLPGELMYGIQVDQDVSCRAVGRCTFGARLDREILDMVPRQLREEMTLEERYAAPVVPLSTNLGRHFLYVRYNADLSDAGLKDLGFVNVNAANIQKMDAVENIRTLLDIGRAAAKRAEADHFGCFL
jgi:hypothetical protein